MRALRDAKPGLRALLGERFIAAYCRLRLREWDDYARHLTQWERDTTLDC